MVVILVLFCVVDRSSTVRISQLNCERTHEQFREIGHPQPWLRPLGSSTDAWYSRPLGGLV